MLGPLQKIFLKKVRDKGRVSFGLARKLWGPNAKTKMTSMEERGWIELYRMGVFVKGPKFHELGNKL